MRVNALIDDPGVVRRILEHLGRWAPEPAERGPPAQAPERLREMAELADRPMLLYDGVILRSLQGAISIRTNSHGSRPKPALSLR